MPIEKPLAIVAAASKHGLGIFATRDIVSQEEFYQYSGRIISFEETLQLGPLEGHAIQVSATKYLYADEPGRLINHSCAPNVGLNEKMRLIALRNIKKGEEIFFDYSTSMMERWWEMPCACGTAICRGVIQDFDLIPIEIQQTYIGHGIVPSFILELANFLKRAKLSTK
jgi:uncharacterized protein